MVVRVHKQCSTRQRHCTASRTDGLFIHAFYLHVPLYSMTAHMLIVLCSALCVPACCLLPQCCQGCKPLSGDGRPRAVHRKGSTIQLLACGGKVCQCCTG